MNKEKREKKNSLGLEVRKEEIPDPRFALRLWEKGVSRGKKNRPQAKCKEKGKR